MVSLNSNRDYLRSSMAQRGAYTENVALTPNTISAWKTTPRTWSYKSFTFRTPAKVRGNLHEAEKCNSAIIHLLEDSKLFSHLLQ